MFQTKGRIFKFKEGKEGLWKKWCNELNTTLKEEALETLKEEGLLFECSAVFKVQTASYALILVKGEALPSDKNKEINKKHQQMKKECFEDAYPLDVLYELNNAQ